ncbi:hypothetical protein LCGC14_2534310 [marine sediment metagenome]|uniref:Uncharacterized protein n=1 Tax=marine sediment metagenome TaxID=412755 RepID=A0A0F9BFH4_9ZZZZ
MVQEDQALVSTVAALERRIRDLERLLTLGLVGSDTEAVLQQHTVLLGRLIGDATLGNILMGPFPSTTPPQVARRDDGAFYLGGTVGVYPADGTFGITANVLYALPFHMTSTPNFMDEIAIEVSTINVGGAGNVRLGIYDDDGSIYPGRLVKDAGTAITGLLGAHKITVNESTPRGLKWLVAVFDVAVELRTTAVLQSAGSWAMLGAGPSNLNFNAIGWQVAFSYAVLPEIYPAGGTKQGSLPIVYLSFKPGGWS